MELRKTYTSTELKNVSGQVCEAALKGPVGISKNGRVILVMLSAEEYEALLSKQGPKEEPGPGVRHWT